MATEIIGSAILSSVLNVISQGLLVPVIIILLIFVVFVIITLGGLITEYLNRRKIVTTDIKDIIYKISDSQNKEELQNTIKSTNLPESQKTILLELTQTENIGVEAREALANNLIEKEESKTEKILAKTDTVTRIGPTLGLMGTLIPMGPGLAALGSGDINTLASAIIVAFDTTVIGIGAGALSYCISKIRRQWYDDYLSNLEALVDTVLELMKEV